MSKVTFEVKEANNQTFVKLSGIIDEDMNFSALAIKNPKSLQIDLELLRGINSCGIREWIKWISEFKDTQIHLVNCPKIVVDQINMVQGFLPEHAKVMSFFVPFFNDDSGSEKNVLLEYGKHYTEEALSIPNDIVDEEGNSMEIDVVESKYFKFLKR